MTNSYTFVQTPVGRVQLTSDGEFLTGLYFNTHKSAAVLQAGRRRDDDIPVFTKAKQELHLYFAGNLIEFSVPIKLAGTEFQLEVWRALTEIPYGKTISYKELALRVGRKDASRAVGLANGKNPISIVVPCHRVIGADGSLTGYGGGLPIKSALLDLERMYLAPLTTGVAGSAKL